MTKSRIFFFVLVSFVAGIAIRSFVPVPYTVLWIGFLGAAFIILFGVTRPVRSKTLKVSADALTHRTSNGVKKSYVFAAYGFFVFAFIFGIFRFDWYESMRPDVGPFYGNYFAMEGYVLRDPSRGEKSQTFRFRITALDGREVSRFDVRITAARSPEYQIGDILALRGTIEKPEKLGDFDYPAYLKKDGIKAVVAFPRIAETGRRAGNRILIYLSKGKRAFEENIERILPEPHGAFLKGLLLGERESLPEELTEAFRKTGVTHLVALSGYNITLVATFFMSLLLFFTVRFYTAFWIAAAGIVGFVILTGAAPSVVRAGIMGILILVAEREGRVYNIRNALACAAALMVFLNPYVLRFDAAFELSFLATIGLVVFSPRIEAYVMRIREGLKSYIGKRTLRDTEKRSLVLHTLAETLGAQAAVLPLIIILFGSVSLVSPVSNVLVVLAVPYTMFFGFLTGVLGFLSSSLASIPGFFAWVLLEYMIRVIELFSRVPYASISIPASVSGIAPLLIALFILFISFRMYAPRQGKI